MNRDLHSGYWRAYFWPLLCIFLAGLGWQLGTNTEIPGPTALTTLKRNLFEATAISNKLPATENVLLLISRSDNDAIQTKDHLAITELITELKQLTISATANQTQVVFNAIYTKGHTLLNESEELYLSSDKATVLVRCLSKVPIYQAAAIAPIWQNSISQWLSQNKQHYKVLHLSVGGIDAEIIDLINRDLDNSLIYTLPITLIILIWVFGSFLTALIPLLTALLCLIGSLGISSILSQLVGPISATSNQLVVLLILAIGVDYSLFFISRAREIFLDCQDVNSTISKTKLKMRPVLWCSGITVAASLAGLYLMQDSVLSSMASVTMFTVLFTVASTIELTPLFIKLLPKILTLQSKHQRSNLISCLNFSLHYPTRSLFLSISLLLILSSPVLDLELGSSMEPAILPHSMQTAQSYQVLLDKFPKLSGSQLDIILEANNLLQLEEAGELQVFFDALHQHQEISGPYNTSWSEFGNLARYSYLIAGNANKKAPQELLNLIRTVYIPQHLEAIKVKAGTSGNLTFVVDENLRYAHRTPLVMLAVLSSSFIFLLFAFKSLVIPLKAIILNLLSTSSAFGILVIIFQYSPGIFSAHQTIEGFVPALLFCVLFGLSMDYHVLLISRVREELVKGQDIRSAVQYVIACTSNQITGAALVMISVFLVIASLELPIMQQLGFGLAIAVLLDATVVRLVILPASLILLGRWNWYLPRFLKNLLDLKFS